MVTNGASIAKAGPLVLPELEAFLEPYAHLFEREPTRRSLERYTTGLLSDLDGKNCDNIAQAVAGTNVQRLHHMVADAEWDSGTMDRDRVGRLSASSPQGGILLLDDTAQVKDGDCSVGVGRQYSGTLGKVGNCQVIVTAHYVADALDSSAPLHWPVAARLYLPKSWADDVERRRRAGVPEDLAFQTKHEIALDMVRRSREWGVPFRFVAADAAYGSNPGFLEGLEEQQVLYVCGVESGFGVRLPAEMQAAADTPPAKHRLTGRPRLRRPAPLHTVKTVSETIPEKAWRTVTWRDGSKGPLRKQFAAIRVHRATGNPAPDRVSASRLKTGPEGWLLVERPLPGEKGDWKWYYSNLPARTSLKRLVRLAHPRWVIEQFYREAKGVCGLDHYQGRSWRGLHRHLALVMLSYTFLVEQRAKASQNPEGGFSPLWVCRDPTTRAQTGVGLAA